MLAVLLSLAAVAEGDEPNKAPFYIFGIMTAAWAVLLFAGGMRSPAFPGSSAAQKGVIAVSVLLVGATMASAVLTS